MTVPSPEEEHFLEDRLYEYNRDQTGHDDGRSFGIFVRDDEQKVIAGLCGWTWARACEIRTLWVHPARRGRGHGRALLESAEREAATRGCIVVLLHTYSFQAPEFYRMCGYRLVWELNGFPPGYQHCGLIKRLAISSR
ncbi:MAG TPA: GNAT family N-acetyltransferase [Polyangiaceae bacterium]